VFSSASHAGKSLSSSLSPMPRLILQPARPVLMIPPPDGRGSLTAAVAVTILLHDGSHGRMYTARRTRSGLGKPGPDFCEVQMTTIMTIDEPRPRGTVIGERVGGPPLD
jgi:hypothetical protein